MYLCISAALMGYYLSLSTIAKVREMYGITEYGHGLVQLQYLCTSSPFSQTDSHSPAEGWKEIFMEDVEESAKRDDEMEIVLPACGDDKIGTGVTDIAANGEVNVDTTRPLLSLQALEELSFLFQARSEVMMEYLEHVGCF
jgi:hypothetical protein